MDNTIVKLESMDDKFEVVVENSKKSTKGKAKKKAGAGKLKLKGSSLVSAVFFLND